MSATGVYAVDARKLGKSQNLWLCVWLIHVVQSFV